MTLKELEDYDWFPLTLRRWQSEFIGHLSASLQLYPNSDQIIVKESKLYDLCSGSGLLIEQFANKHDICLKKSDKYPIYKDIDQLDVLDLYPSSDYCYTIFNAFHHFTKSKQLAIVDNFQRTNSSFIIVEVLTPDLMTLIKVCVGATIIQPLMSVFVKPFSIFRIITSTILPINTLTVLWDGIISVFKSKTIKSYRIQFDTVPSLSEIAIIKMKTTFGLPIIVITNCEHA